MKVSYFLKSIYILNQKFTLCFLSATLNNYVAHDKKDISLSQVFLFKHTKITSSIKSCLKTLLKQSLKQDRA